MLRIGLLGCGRIGQVHARTIKGMDDARVVAVSDAMPEAADRLAAEVGAEVRTSEAILGAQDIDAVVIGTPTDTHFDLIHGAARAGKAIFCEKPIDMSVDNIRACIEVVEETGVPFLTGFNRRFDPNFAALRARIGAGDIGAVELVTITSRDPAPPPISYIERSGGLFRDMMIHDFDMARFLMGEAFVRLHAVGSALVDPAIGAAGDVDTAAVILTTGTGRICQISNSRRAAYGYDQRIEVHGAGKSWSGGLGGVAGDVLGDGVECPLLDLGFKFLVALAQRINLDIHLFALGLVDGVEFFLQFLVAGAQRLDVLAAHRIHLVLQGEDLRLHL
jgi:myo-inositol 2-dehydrogenase/D-chiro-inositol 1-dehydrogenase